MSLPFQKNQLIRVAPNGHWTDDPNYWRVGRVFKVLDIREYGLDKFHFKVKPIDGRGEATNLTRVSNWEPL